MRLLAESAAIISSILLAFAIDAWWEDRKDAGYEQTALTGLQEEFKRHNTDIKAQIGFHELLMSGVAFADAVLSGWKLCQQKRAIR